MAQKYPQKGNPSRHRNGEILLAHRLPAIAIMLPILAIVSIAHTAASAEEQRIQRLPLGLVLPRARRWQPARKQEAFPLYRSEVCHPQ